MLKPLTEGRFGPPPTQQSSLSAHPVVKHPSCSTCSTGGRASLNRKFALASAGAKESSYAEDTQCH